LHGVYNVQGEILDWDGQSALKFIERYGKPDVIIGADLIYHESAFEPLVQTLQSLSDKNTQIVITGKERYKELNEKFISLLKAFNLEKYDILVLEDLVSDERDYVYILTRKEATSVTIDL
jgi:predicted nicotinamide N-methyase